MLSQTQSVKILVVDDEEIMLKLACDALRSQGHQVASASGALEALDKLKQERFDFILTDIKMPEMDGMELIQTAHQIDPSMGAIFMTGYASLDTAKKAIQEGAYDYILKPFDLQEIRDAVNQAIKKREQTLKRARTNGINQIFELNQKLYSAGDSESLLKLCLQSALMQSRLKKGMILYWRQENNELKILQAKDPEKNLFVGTTAKIDPELLAEWSQKKEVLLIKSLRDYSFFSDLTRLLPRSSRLDELLQLEGEAILIPLVKAESACGVLTLVKTPEEQMLQEEDLKLLSILGIQTAISLENIRLLNNAQQSYRELQSLQDQIISLEKMAIRGRISAEIGHELNNYLTVLWGNFEILSMKIRKAELHSLNRQLETISASLDRIKRFADGLMDFSALKAEKKECDINDLIQRTLLFIKPQNIFKNISLVTELKPNLPHLVVDAGQIQQVLYNLLNNAADAMGKRKGEGGTITVGTDYHPEKESVEIWVKDTGKGMTKDQLEKIFQTGFTTKEFGHGMGLSICRKIVEDHNGTIQAESQLNKGTTFRVKLPLKRKDKDTSSTTSEGQGQL